MTNDELMTLALAIIHRCKSQETGQDCIEIEKAVNTINHGQCKALDIDFAFNVLKSELEDFEYWNKKQLAK